MAESTSYDRLKELIEFDLSKAGVKGLIDSGVEKIPRIFHHPLEDLPKPPMNQLSDHQVPVIDISDINNQSRRLEIIDSICDASASWGFFQLVNHGIPKGVLDELIEKVRMFHEQDQKIKAEFYTRDPMKKVKYDGNFDLFYSPCASWRDTLHCIDDGSLNPNEIPSVCRDVILEYHKQVFKVANTVLELLSESLGLNSDYLKSINCGKMRHMVAHYYPPCPEPELTFGTTKHADASFITLLVQDGLGGLQVRHQNEWIDVSPVPQALIVNVGDLLQLISNGKFKSVHHRVLASHRGPRISVAVFMFPQGDEERLYGPIAEILSVENRPKYRQVRFRDYFAYFSSKGLGKEHALDGFKL